MRGKEARAWRMVARRNAGLEPGYDLALKPPPGRYWRRPASPSGYPMKKLVLAFLLAATPALGQTPPPVSGEMETVYSDAMKERDQTLARRFVQSLLKSPITMEDQYAKWTVPVCPHVYGLAPGPTYVVERRIRDVAAQVGAPVDRDEFCRHNVSIIVTEDPQATLDSI